MKSFISFILLSIAAFGGLMAQDTIRYERNNTVVYGLILDGDTLLLSSIEEVYIFPRRRFSSDWEYRKYQRLIRNVKKAYPYAKMAKQKYDEVEEHFLTLKSEKSRKVYIKQVEKEIMNQYEDELKKLTITQGRILIKLIDREIGETSYDLLKDLKGSFSAFFWQTIARIFGSNLKSNFDAEGEDRLINEIVILIERGVL
ncbi:MAG: DUF4294 domain-containing protein [Bacteroidales bacterium]|nr:DUF4294 domain-containing protein [Bacteroidales bacterium]